VRKTGAAIWPPPRADRLRGDSPLVPGSVTDANIDFTPLHGRYTAPLVAPQLHDLGLDGMSNLSDLRRTFESYGQAHLLRFWAELGDDRRQELVQIWTRSNFE